MRIVCFLTVLVLSTLLPWYLLVFLAAIYAFYWRTALELLLIAALIDGYFGVHAGVPMYTLTAVVLLFVVEWMKPRLVIYNER